MTFLKLLTYIPSITGILIIAIIVMARNHTARLRNFALLSISIALWLSAQFVTEISTGSASLQALRVGTIFPNLLVYFFTLFVFEQAGRVIGFRFKVLLAALVILMSPFSLTDLIIRNVSHTGNSFTTEVGPLYNVQTIILVSIIAYGLVVLFRASKKNRDAVTTTQNKILLLSLLIPISVNLVINSLFLQVSAAQAFGPLSILLMVSLVSYAIIKHKLFDIRAIIARSIAYAALVAVLAFLYSASILVVASVINRNYQLSNNARTAIYTILAVFLALTFQSIKRATDRVTNKIFYRDAYDAQYVLDQVGKIIVGSFDFHKIQKNTLKVLYDNLRPTYAGFIFAKSGDGFDHEFVGDHPTFNDTELSQLFSKVSKTELLYDELPESQAKLKSALSLNKISYLIPLITKNELIGYLVMGNKKSGNIFNGQDQSTIAVISNELAVALQNAQRFEEIQAFNITLQEKVNEATRELKSTNKKLVALDEAKDEFISMASHQLRTPLTSIKGYLSMILDGDMGKMNKNQTAALKEAFGSSQRMVFLISDFLNVSRIRTGKFVIEPKEVNLPQLVGEELNQLKELAESRDITLKYESPGEFPTVKLDDNKIRQVMMNMVDNAIYYTPVGGTVTIQLYLDAQDVVFKVVDTGIGVPKEEQHKLFSKFFRAGNARVARPDGTGLGLFMAQKIIVAQNGSVIFESEEGRGSTFGFRFPLKQIKL